MNENKHSPDETAVGERTDYAVHFADGFFVPCPCCGKEVESPDNGFTSEKEAMEWALGTCDCPGYIGTADPADETMAKLSGLSVEQLEQYRDGGWLYGLKVQNPRRLPEPVPLEAIHMDRAPQSWCWLNSINAADLAEIAAAQGVKL